MLRDTPGYQLQVAGTGACMQNPVLVRDGVKVLGVDAEVMCDAVGESPARAATIVRYELGGETRAHIQTHANAHIQKGQTPQPLPRVKEDIRHMLRLEAMVHDLLGQGCRVTVAGDFNWAWDADDQDDWHYCPKAVFTRLGMVTQFDAPTEIPGGTLGRRRIDYIAYLPEDLAITGQSIVAPEHSDHRWEKVDFVTV